MTNHWGSNCENTLSRHQPSAKLLWLQLGRNLEQKNPHGSSPGSVGHFQHAALSIPIIIFIRTQTALPKALLSSEGFDLVEKFIVNIIFRPLTEESSSVWGK